MYRHEVRGVAQRLEHITELGDGVPDGRVTILQKVLGHLLVLVQCLVQRGDHRGYRAEDGLLLLWGNLGVRCVQQSRCLAQVGDNVSVAQQHTLQFIRDVQGVRDLVQRLSGGVLYSDDAFREVFEVLLVFIGQSTALLRCDGIDGCSSGCRCGRHSLCRFNSRGARCLRIAGRLGGCSDAGRFANENGSRLGTGQSCFAREQQRTGSKGRRSCDADRTDTADDALTDLLTDAFSQVLRIVDVHLRREVLGELTGETLQTFFQAFLASARQSVADTAELERSAFNTRRDGSGDTAQHSGRYSRRPPDLGGDDILGRFRGVSRIDQCLVLGAGVFKATDRSAIESGKGALCSTATFHQGVGDDGAVPIRHTGGCKPNVLNQPSAEPLAKVSGNEAACPASRPFHRARDWAEGQQGAKGIGGHISDHRTMAERVVDRRQGITSDTREACGEFAVTGRYVCGFPLYVVSVGEPLLCSVEGALHVQRIGFQVVLRPLGSSVRYTGEFHGGARTRREHTQHSHAGDSVARPEAGTDKGVGEHFPRSAHCGPASQVNLRPHGARGVDLHGRLVPILRGERCEVQVGHVPLQLRCGRLSVAGALRGCNSRSHTDGSDVHRRFLVCAGRVHCCNLGVYLAWTVCSTSYFRKFSGIGGSSRVSC